MWNVSDWKGVMCIALHAQLTALLGAVENSAGQVGRSKHRKHRGRERSFTICVACHRPQRQGLFHVRAFGTPSTGRDPRAFSRE